MFESLRGLFSSSGKPADKPKQAPKPIDDPIGPINSASDLDNVGGIGMKRNWIGIDLDGTLAYFDGWKGFEYIGKPVPAMKARVREWLAQGFEVKVFTARASVPEGVEPIRKWLEANGMPELGITCSKDFHMVELWDDRAVQVVPNTGSPVLSARWAAQPRAPLFGIERSSSAARVKEEEQASSSGEKKV
jgi:hypothetical protein